MKTKNKNIIPLSFNTANLVGYFLQPAPFTCHQQTNNASRIIKTKRKGSCWSPILADPSINKSKKSQTSFQV